MRKLFYSQLNHFDGAVEKQNETDRDKDRYENYSSEPAPLPCFSLRRDKGSVVNFVNRVFVCKHLYILFVIKHNSSLQPGEPDYT